MATNNETNAIEKAFDTEAGEWPIRKSTIYNDQAEVTRSLSFKPDTAGIYSIKLKGLPQKIKSESIRADIPSANAGLLEVSYSQDTENGQADPAIEQQIEQLEEEKNELNQELQILAMRRTKIDQHKNYLTASLNSKAIETTQKTLSPEVFERLSAADLFYAELQRNLDEEQEKLSGAIAELQTQINDLRTQQNKNQVNKTIRSVTIMIDVPELYIKKSKKTVDIDLFYLVRDASWFASYDIKVDKTDTDKAALSYYGNVRNNTGENWVEVEMSLSTAQPSVGGQLPPLPRKQVDFRSSYNNAMAWQRHGSFGDEVQGGFAASNAILNVGGAGGSNAEVSGDSGSALFRIQRLANIDSDNKPHKQTIVLLELEATYTHAASPKVSPDVFLKCSTKNGSAFTFLPGTLGVFLDGSFVSNSDMKMVRPNEDFSLFLGIDDSVKLSYGPEVVNKKTIKGGAFGSKKPKWVKKVGREITIMNNSPNIINCCIYEQLPYSNDKTIKVELVSPDMKKPDKRAKHIINDFNNLETTTSVNPSKQFKMMFEYEMEWPEGEEIKLYKN